MASPSIMYRSFNQLHIFKLNDPFFQRFSLLASATVAIVLLIVFLSKWSSLLGREVQRRTMELELSNEEIISHLNLVEKKLKRLYFDS